MSLNHRGLRRLVCYMYDVRRILIVTLAEVGFIALFQLQKIL